MSEPGLRPTVVFVTDYGWDDTYAASLAGAAWRVDPSVRCVSGTHGVPPGDVLAGAYHLKAVAMAFGPGVVICAVVDPGVGTDRRGLAVRTGGVTCVAPDNGLATYLWSEADPAQRWAVELPVPPSASATFAGRDVFAPAAARLAAGAPLGDIGTPTPDVTLDPDALAEREGSTLLGRVAVVDRFGNAITTVRACDLGDAAAVAASWRDGRVAQVVRTYEEITGPLGLLVGSAGHLEVAARRGRAVDRGGPHSGERVRIEFTRPGG